MKIVIDTNVVVSALFFGGKPEKLLQYAAQENVNAVVSKEIIDEYYCSAFSKNNSLS